MAEVFRYLAPPSEELAQELFPGAVCNQADKTIGMALSLFDVVSKGIDHFSQSIHCSNCLENCIDPSHTNPLFLDLRLGGVRLNEIQATFRALTSKHVRALTVDLHQDRLGSFADNPEINRHGIQILAAVSERELRKLREIYGVSQPLVGQIEQLLHQPIDQGCTGVLVPPSYVELARKLLPDAQIATRVALKQDQIQHNVAGANHLLYPRGFTLAKLLAGGTRGTD